MLAHQSLRNMPYTIDMRAFKRVELLGDIEHTEALARALVCQAAVWHSPEHLRVLVLTSVEHAGRWDWIRLLPHSHTLNEEFDEGWKGASSTPSGLGRFMVTTNTHMVDGLVGDDVVNRNRYTGDDEISPHVIVINDGFDRDTLAKETRLFSSDGLGGVTVIDMPSQWGELEEDDVLRVLF